MRKKVAIGIDLGTTNSAVGVWNNGRVELVENKEGIRITPSYVYYSPSENYVGRLAIEKSGTDPENVLFDAKRLLAQMIDSQEVQEFKQNWSFRVIGHPDPGKGKAHFVSVYEETDTPIPPEQISAEILKSLLNDVCRKLNVEKDNVEAVIAVPAYFNTNQKRATMDAAKAAGINVKQILSEPVAAALSYKLKREEENKLEEGDTVFVFDLGGGTFDVTIMRIKEGVYEVIAIGGDTHLGGRDFDQVISKIIEERLRKQLGDDKVNELRSRAEYRHKLNQLSHDVKESLTQAESEVLSLSDICPDTKDEEVTRVEFEEKSQHLQDKIKKCCEDTLHNAGVKANIDFKNINHIILVGGASRMKMITKILRTIFPPEKPFSKPVVEDEAIAIGATIYAAQLLEVSESPLLKNLKIRDALPLSIGIQDEENKFSTVLRNNSPILVPKSISWKTTENEQTCITIPIYEGLSDDIKENTCIGEIEINGIPPKPAGESTVVLSLKVDMNGNLDAEACVNELNTPLVTKIAYKMEFNSNPIASKMIRKNKKKVVIGIDIGTTNSAVAVWNNEKVELVENSEGKRTTSSYAYYSPGGNYVGKMAVEKSSTDPENVFFDVKRLLAETIDSPNVKKFIPTWPFKVIGHPDPEKGKAHFVSIHKGVETPIAPEKVLTDIFKSLLNDVCRRLDVMKNDVEAVITVPAYFNVNQKRAVLEAAEAAEINVKQILSEPVAAVLAYQQELTGENELTEGNSIFAFDLSGGTFDVAIIKIENGTYKVIALGGDTHLGGRDFDRVLVEIIKERLQKQLGNDKVNELLSQPTYRHKLNQIAHEVKQSFTQTDTEVLCLSDICPDAEDEEVTREEFKEKSQDLQEKIRKCCESTLQDAKIKAGIDVKDIDHVLLVGGASKMRMVEEILRNIFPGKTLSKTVSGDEAIAIGATLYAAKLLEVSKSPSIENLKTRDALPLSIGISNEENKFKPVLKNNSSLPVHNRIEWKTTEDKQICITIPIYEGLSEDITKNTYIGDIQIKKIPPKPAGEVVVTVFLEVDKNGIPRARSQNSETKNIIDIPILYKMKFGEDKVVSEMIHGGAKKYAIGIDLGTTNSAVGIWHPEGVELSVTDNRVTPSYVYFSPNGNYVGRKAFEKSRIDPENVFFDTKRLLAQTIDSPKVREFIPTWPFKVIGHPDPEKGKAHFVSVHRGVETPIPPEKILTTTLKYMVNNVCRRLDTTENSVEAVITVPAYFNTAQKRATMEAAEVTGISVKQILSEPVAAALSYKLRKEEEKLEEGDSLFMFDLGGGTFDVTVMKIEEGVYKVIALGGDTHLGGRDFDQILTKIIQARLRKQIGDAKVDELISQPKYRYRLIDIARNAKEAFTVNETQTVSLSRICTEATDEEITRAEFEGDCQEFRSKITKCCNDTLDAAKIDPKDIDHVLLIGRASKMKMVLEILESIFQGKTFSKAVNGDEAVAIGATMYAARLLNIAKDPAIREMSI